MFLQITNFWQGVNGSEVDKKKNREIENSPPKILKNDFLELSTANGKIPNSLG